MNAELIPVKTVAWRRLRPPGGQLAQRVEPSGGPSRAARFVDPSIAVEEGGI